MAELCRRPARLLAWILTPAAAAALGLSAGGCHKEAAAAAPKMPPPAVTVAVAEQRDVPVYVDEIGKCAAVEAVMVSPQVTGQISKIHFADGADIAKDKLLFSIDDAPFLAQLGQAKAQLAQATAATEFADIEFKRVTGLRKTEAVAQSDVDTKKNALDLATAQVQSAQAAVKIQQLNVDYCQIKSPIDGRAGQRLVDAGNIVKANEAQLLSIQRINDIYADFTVTERELPAVQANMANHALKRFVRLPADPDQGREGDLTFLDNSVQDGSGTVKLRATLKNADQHFWPGQFVNVRLVLTTKKNAILVPMTAVQLGQKGAASYAFVYVVKDAPAPAADGSSTKPGGATTGPAQIIAEQRIVTTGQQQGDQVVIENNVAADERVITTGQLMVIPNGPVRVIDAGAAGSPDTPGPAAPVANGSSPAALAPTTNPAITRPEPSLGLSGPGSGTGPGRTNAPNNAPTNAPTPAPSPSTRPSQGGTER